MRLSIIVPVYDEIETLPKVLDKLAGLSLDLEKEIIVVDDGSTDGSRQFLKDFIQINTNPLFKIAFHPQNLGKGNAIQTALEYVTGDIVIIQDADLEYDPDQYSILLEPFLVSPPFVKGGMGGFSEVKVVYGSRFLQKNKNIYRRYLWGNKFLTWLCNLFCDTKVTDSYTGYKLFRSGIIKNLDLKSNGFEIEAEITAKLGKKKISIYEVPIDYNPRKLEEGKKIGWCDALKGIWTILKYKFNA